MKMWNNNEKWHYLFKREILKPVVTVYIFQYEHRSYKNNLKSNEILTSHWVTFNAVFCMNDKIGMSLVIVILS